MVNDTIRMTVSADKRNEIPQAIRDLRNPIRNEKDCLNCHCFLDIKADDIVIFAQEWKNNEALTTHLRSGHFKVLFEVMKLHSIEPEIRINTVIATGGLEPIAA